MCLDGAKMMSEVNDELMNVKEQCEALQNELDERSVVKDEVKDEVKEEKLSDGKLDYFSDWS